MVWSIRGLKHYVFGVFSWVFTNHEYFQQIGLTGETNDGFSTGWSFVRLITSACLIAVAMIMIMIMLIFCSDHPSL